MSLIDDDDRVLEEEGRRRHLVEQDTVCHELHLLLVRDNRRFVPHLVGHSTAHGHVALLSHSLRQRDRRQTTWLRDRDAAPPGLHQHLRYLGALTTTGFATHYGHEVALHSIHDLGFSIWGNFDIMNYLKNIGSYFRVASYSGVRVTARGVRLSSFNAASSTMIRVGSKSYTSSWVRSSGSYTNSSLANPSAFLFASKVSKLRSGRSLLALSSMPSSSKVYLVISSDIRISYWNTAFWKMFTLGVLLTTSVTDSTTVSFSLTRRVFCTRPSLVLFLIEDMRSIISAVRWFYVSAPIITAISFSFSLRSFMRPTRDNFYFLFIN